MLFLLITPRTGASTNSYLSQLLHSLTWASRQKDSHIGHLHLAETALCITQMAPLRVHNDEASERGEAIFEAVKEKLYDEDLDYEIARFVTKHRMGCGPVKFFSPTKGGFSIPMDLRLSSGSRSRASSTWRRKGSRISGCTSLYR